MAKNSAGSPSAAAMRRLKRKPKRQGVSGNRNASEERKRKPSNKAQALVAHWDRDALAGTWSARDARDFDRAVAPFGQMDKALWR